MNNNEEIIDREIGLISQCTIKDGELVHCAIIDSEIRDGFMDGTTITDTRWGGATFNNVFLDGANLAHMSMRGARFKLVNMKDVSINELSMEGSVFEDVTLADCTMDRINFKNAKIKSSDLKGIEITDCGCRGMTINGVPVEKLAEAYNILHPDSKIEID